MVTMQGVAHAESVRDAIGMHVTELIRNGQDAKLVETAEFVQLCKWAGYTSTSDKQLRDYTAFILRGSEHVCRYARGLDSSFRLVHVSARCSPACKTIKFVYKNKPKQVQCGTCFVNLPVGQPCGICE